MKITAAASYAVTAVAHVANAQAGQVVANSEISAAHKFPERFLLQVLRQLVNDGILASTRGVHGGYKLAKPANKITLLEIIESVDGPLQFGFRGDGFNVDSVLSPKVTTVIQGALASIENVARKRLGAITIANLRAAKAA